MSDGTRLAEQIIEEFDAEVGKSAAVRRFYELAEKGNTTYREANEAAKEIGEILARAYQKYLGQEHMPQEQVVYELAREILSPTMYHDHETVAEIAATAQENLNKKAGVGIRAIRPEFDQSKVDSLAGRIAKEEKFKDVSWIFDAPIRNFTQSIVDQTAKANMEFQGKAGLRPVVARRTSGRCCAWCLALAGTYEYPGAPKDVFRRHNNCNCTVECNPMGGSAFQNVWNKNEWRYEKDDGKIKERTQLGTDTLEYSEKVALNQYKSFESYLLNEALREGKELTDAQRRMMEALDAALEKLPRYEGVTYRSLDIARIKDIDAFWKRYTPGNIVLEDSYISTSTEVYDESFEIQMIISGKNGRDLRGYTEMENEILYPRNKRFRVTKREGSTLWMEEKD